MAIDEKDIERLKDIFVTKDKCQQNIDIFDRKLSNDLVKISVIETKLNIITWLLGAITTGIITVLIKLFFGG